MKIFRIALFYAMILIPLPASAAVHALLIGFNDYPGMPLKGAIADVQDLSGVLKRRGVEDIVTLTDGKTTVADFKQAWTQMTARAKPGDLILIGFSGHGIRLRETRNPRRTPDGYDKGFLFPSFNEDDHPDELLRDEDLYDLFKVASANGLHILFIVDACHAGTGLRQIPQQLRPFKFRVYSERPNAPAAEQPVDVPPRPPIANVAAITAQLAQKTITEIIVDGQNRGALSYAVARGLEGSVADPDRTGSITLDNLWHFVRDDVRTRSDNQQAPTLYSRPEDGGMVIFSDGSQPPKLTSKVPEIPDLHIYSSAQTVSINHASTIAKRDEADLIWDPKGTLIDSSGNVLSDNIDSQKLQDASDARRLILFLRKTAELNGTLDVRFHKSGLPNGTSDDRYQVKDTRLQFESNTSSLEKLFVFDVSADGTVTFLFPQDGDDPTKAESALSSIQVKVQPPFGADFAIIIRSDVPLTETREFFIRRSNEAKASDLLEILPRDLGRANFRIGIQGLYTCASLTKDEKCEMR
jgi:hypothetical protein